MNDFNDRYSLGKGEVDSSILSGSTRKDRGIGIFEPRLGWDPAVSGRTAPEHDNSTRGKSVESVPAPSILDKIDRALTALEELGLDAGADHFPAC